MCGIAGFCNYHDNYLNKADYWDRILTSMRERIDHRGGDQAGSFLDRNIGFAHSRLSIRDIEGAIQPMQRRVGGYDYIIIYNGEIYNTDELSAPLKQKGYVFETTGDTEVILYSYIEYGPEFVSQLNGIFAFAIWDDREKRLMLCRDRVGVKPLFYSLKNNLLVFGSEIKALFRHPGVHPAIDDNSLREIFGLGPSRTAGCGVFHGINEILPGNYAIFSQDGFTEHNYWRLKAARHADSYEQTVDNVSFLVKDAITRQMVSDIPVCTFLSGGLDSSIVTAVAADFMCRDGMMLNTFSFDFSGNDKYFASNQFQPTRDRPYVEKMIKAFPLNHAYLECNEKELVDMLPAAMRAKDLPGMTDVDASLMYFCSLVKQQNKVVLTGECADEIFGGYPWFYREELFNTDGFPWSTDLAARTMLLNDETIARLELKPYIRQRYKESISETPKLEGEESPEETRHREISYLNMRWFMSTLLDRMDRMSMSCGLEARVPFADHRIIEYLYNVPWSMKYKDGVEKSLLRNACRGLLPDELLWRKKSPYPKTYNPEYEALLIQEFYKVLNNRESPVNRFISRDKVEHFLSIPKDYGKPWFGQLMAGPQMLAYILQVNDWLIEYALG